MKNVLLSLLAVAAFLPVAALAEDDLLTPGKTYRITFIPEGPSYTYKIISHEGDSWYKVADQRTPDQSALLNIDRVLLIQENP